MIDAQRGPFAWHACRNGGWLVVQGAGVDGPCAGNGTQFPRCYCTYLLTDDACRLGWLMMPLTTLHACRSCDKLSGSLLGLIVMSY
jgi:hypothetical protein